MHTLLQLIKMFKFKNLIACGMIMIVGSVFAQAPPDGPGGPGGGAPTMKALVAGGDALNVTNPASGSVNLFLNDFADALNITAADIMPMGDLAVGLISDGGLSVPTNLSLDGTNGVLTVSGSPAPGVYTVTYQVCQPILAPNCSNTASVTVTVTAAPAVLVANTDSVSVVSGTGGTLNILTNDTRNAVLAPTTVQVDVNSVSGLVAGITHTGGVLTVATTVAAGTYPVTYKICEAGGITNCSGTATATITVTAAPAVVAAADSVSVVAGTGGTLNILTNDTYSGGAATTANVVVNIVSGLGATITHNGTGTLTATTAAVAGSYPVVYNICQTGVPTNCSANATATITVTAAPAVLIANADSGSLAAGVGVTFSIISNDTFNGLTATSTTVAVTNLSSLPIGITHNGSGLLTVATTLAAGVYPLSYKICEVGNLTNCSRCRDISRYCR
jgi:large repetitive protein